MKQKSSKQSKYCLVVNIICIATALVCVGLTIWGNIKNDGVLTTDAYIGIIATLIGICATIMVGFQIINYIDVKETKIRLEEVECIYEQSKMDMENFKNIILQHSEYLGNSFIFMGKNNAETIANRLRCYFWAFMVDKNYNDSDLVKKRLSSFYDLIIKSKSSDMMWNDNQIDKFTNLEFPKTVEISKLFISIVEEMNKRIIHEQ